jgi:hypothetical protein
MKTVQRASGKQKTSDPSDLGAAARIEVRRTDDKVRLEVIGASPDAVFLIQHFVGTFDPNAHLENPGKLATPVFQRPIRLDSVGLDDSNEVESVTFEADVTRVVLHVDERHQDRAIAFCQRHRHTTTTEAMDDLAAEFERVAREAKAAAFRAAGGWCVDQASAAKEGTGKDG